MKRAAACNAHTNLLKAVRLSRPVNRALGLFGSCTTQSAAGGAIVFAFELVANARDGSWEGSLEGTACGAFGKRRRRRRRGANGCRELHNSCIRGLATSSALSRTAASRPTSSAILFESSRRRRSSRNELPPRCRWASSELRAPSSSCAW